MKILSALLVLFLLQACKHPLAIEGEGDIIERLAGLRGCSLEEFQAGSSRCAENDVVEENYIVSYEGVPRPGWRFVAWRAGTPCAQDSVAPYCEYNAGQALVALMDEKLPGFALPATTAVFGQPDSWSARANIPSDGSHRSTCAIAGKIYVMGGEIEVPGEEDEEGRLEAYDPSTDTWSTLADMPTQTVDATASAVNGKCYIIGGSQEGDEGKMLASVDVDEYDPKTDTWRARAPLPQKRALAGSAAVDGKIYVFGGARSFDLDALAVATVDIYDPATDSWSTGADMPTPRGEMGVAALDGFIYTVGGVTALRDLPHSDVLERYDSATDSWTTLAPMPTSRWGLALSVADGALYATGGTDNENALATLERYDPETDSWSAGANMSQRRAFLSSASLDEQVYVLAGVSNLDEDDDDNEINVVEKYTP